MGVGEYIILAALFFIGAYLVSRLIGLLVQFVVVPFLQWGPVQRYVSVNSFEDEEPAEQPTRPGVAWAEPAAERPEPVSDRTPDTNAPERGSVGSGTNPNASETPDLNPALVPMLQAIAAHKLQEPGATKAETIYKVFGARKGSSRAYQQASAAWDTLYPPAAPTPFRRPRPPLTVRDVRGERQIPREA